MLVLANPEFFGLHSRREEEQEEEKAGHGFDSFTWWAPAVGPPCREDRCWHCNRMLRGCTGFGVEWDVRWGRGVGNVKRGAPG